jgi:hypothetical protein
MVIVDTGKVLLVCKKDQAQKVRQAVNLLKNPIGLGIELREKFCLMETTWKPIV